MIIATILAIYFSIDYDLIQNITVINLGGNSTDCFIFKKGT